MNDQVKRAWISCGHMVGLKSEDDNIAVAGG